VIDARRLRLAASRPSRDSRWLLAGLLVLFAALAGLDAAGAFTCIDQYAVDHLMPSLTPPVKGAPSDPYGGLYSPFSTGTNWWCTILDLWCYPCSVLISGLVLACTLVSARRRGHPAPALALALALAWALGNAIELGGKSLIVRPALYLTRAGLRQHITTFDKSFPSGHMIRGMIVATLVVALWPQAKRYVVVWYAFVGPFLVLSSSHTPSDVVGGLVIAGVLVGGARAVAPLLARKGVPSRLGVLSLAPRGSSGRALR
jgi:membrane-associated phospholipid phosphatase